MISILRRHRWPAAQAVDKQGASLETHWNRMPSDVTQTLLNVQLFGTRTQNESCTIIWWVSHGPEARTKGEALLRRLENY